MLSAMRELAYGASADKLEEINRLAQSTNMTFLNMFAEQWWKFMARNGCDYRRLWSASG
jgi:hypothetical protein